MIRVTFADGATEDRDDDSPCIGSLLDPALKHPSEERWYLWLDGDRWPLSFCGHSASPLSQWRGWGAWVWRITSGKGEPLAGRWESCHVETCEEQIARLTAERDAALEDASTAEGAALLLAKAVTEQQDRADLATAWGSREAEALRLTTRTLSLACSPIEDDVAREVLIRAICAAKEALAKAQPGMALDVAAVCSRLARADAAEKRLADLRAWADDIVKRSREEAPKHPGKANTTWTILSVLEWVVARIDGKEG